MTDLSSVGRKARYVVALVALGMGVIGASGAPAASAGIAGDCDQTLTQPFLPWLDPGNYEAVPGGDFETEASGWSLNGARVVAGNEPWQVTGTGSSSLSLPPGASATAPEVCIGLLHPTMRFFARNSGLLGLGLLEVDADIHAAGVTLTLPVGVFTGSAGWAPTLPWPLLANLTTPLDGMSSTVSLRFHALTGTWQIDDVYVDPFKT